MRDSILSIKNLKKTYPSGVEALKGVTFDVEKGEFLVVIGLSGAGKSTLLRCLNRLLDPTLGEIYFKQTNIAQLKNKKAIQNLRTKIGMVFQHFNLISRHTVLDNVLMGKLSSTGTWKSILGLFSNEDKAEALKYLQLVGLSDKAYIRADQLSGGQQQRVALARALTQHPEILLADEPVASLDPSMSRLVMDYLKKINTELGITIVCNLHNLDLVRQYATRVIALKDGEIIYQGKVESITEAWFERVYGS